MLPKKIFFNSLMAYCVSLYSALTRKDTVISAKVAVSETANKPCKLKICKGTVLKGCRKSAEKISSEF